MVTALSPVASPTQPEAQMEWEKAVQSLRRDGARPKEVHSFFSLVYFSHLHLPRQIEGH
jgi:putative alpha-1,2-mannosidase